jgi:hypothetical protein
MTRNTENGCDPYCRASDVRERQIHMISPHLMKLPYEDAGH